MPPLNGFAILGKFVQSIPHKNYIRVVKIESKQTNSIRLSLLDDDILN